MVGTLISHARKRGVFKKDNGQEFSYDNVVLYVATSLPTYENKNGCSLTGYPVTLIEVKIPVSKFAAMTNAAYSDDFLTDHYCDTIQVFYDIAVYNGSQQAVLSRVEF